MASNCSSGSNGETEKYDFEVTNKTINVRDVLKTFVYTLLHTPDWIYPQSSAACVALITQKNGTKVILICENEGRDGPHAEEKLITYLQSNKANITGPVKIFQNYSPCNSPNHKCSSAFLELKQGQPKVDFDIRFAALYRIKRPSCENRDNWNFHCNVAIDEDAIEYLLKLGDSVRCFVPDDWTELIELLSKWEIKNERDVVGLDYEYNKVKHYRDKEDEVMTEDFRQLCEIEAQNALTMNLRDELSLLCLKKS